MIFYSFMSKIARIAKFPGQSWVSKPQTLGPAPSSFSVTMIDDRAITGKIKVVHSILANTEGPHLEDRSKSGCRVLGTEISGRKNVVRAQAVSPCRHALLKANPVYQM